VLRGIVNPKRGNLDYWDQRDNESTSFHLKLLDVWACRIGGGFSWLFDTLGSIIDEVSRDPADCFCLKSVQGGFKRWPNDAAWCPLIPENTEMAVQATVISRFGLSPPSLPGAGMSITGNTGFGALDWTGRSH